MTEKILLYSLLFINIVAVIVYNVILASLAQSMRQEAGKQYGIALAAAVLLFIITHLLFIIKIITVL
jgi:hypothetical protein